MDALFSQRLVKQSTVALSNRLVLIAPANSKGSGTVAEQLLAPEIRKVAMGEPESVPAGEYARQAMKALGTWEKLQSKLVYAHDVRQVLAYVETGNSDIGFVYRTDAIRSRKVRMAAEIPETSHEPIVYPFGLLSSSRHESEAADFFRYLTSEPAMNIFEKNGFITTQNTQ